MKSTPCSVLSEVTLNLIHVLSTLQPYAWSLISTKKGSASMMETDAHWSGEGLAVKGPDSRDSWFGFAGVASDELLNLRGTKIRPRTRKQLYGWQGSTTSLPHLALSHTSYVFAYWSVTRQWTTACNIAAIWPWLYKEDYAWKKLLFPEQAATIQTSQDKTDRSET